MADEKIDYFDGIRDHFSQLDTQIIEVPEWGLTGDKAIHTKPFNMLEKQKIFKVLRILICLFSLTLSLKKP